jgi:acyl-coenzyme A synthetase/AMP-(fatty) acid ligase
MNAAECLLCVGVDDAVAIECGAERIDYRQLRDAVRRAAHAWQALGVEAGARVILFAPDSIEWVIAYLGVIWAGGVAIGVNPRLRLPDLAAIVTDSEVGFIWCEDDLSHDVSAMAKALPSPAAVITTDGGAGLSWSSALDEAFGIDARDLGGEDPALWIGTSGTTGIPKGVVHPHRVVLDSQKFAQEVLGLTGEDRLYATSKLFFAYALANSLFAGLRLGATVILDRERPTPEHVHAMVARHRPTVLFTVPTLYNKMLQANVAPAFKGSTIRRFVSAGEAMPKGIRTAWKANTGLAPVSGYGTSETLCIVLYCDDDSGYLRPTPLTSVRHSDNEDASAPQRIWIRNPSLAQGYWRRPAAQADSFREGWYSPGDLFLRHDDDRLEFAGRCDDLVKVSGQWVSMLWVEHALAEAGGDAIDQIAAVAVSTEEGLTTLSVLAVAVPGREDAAKIRLAAAVDHLPQHRRPSWIHWVSELPVTATGKVQRSRLRDAHEIALSSAARKEAAGKDPRAVT